MIVVEKANSFWIGAQAALLQDSHAEIAWAEPLIRKDPHLRWIVGRYVQADVPNRNGHIFPSDDLKAKVATIAHKPVNMLHNPDNVIGHYAGAELVVPKAATGAATADQHPVIETLAALYAWYYPDEVAKVEKAFADGFLSQSMECVPDQLQCATCDTTHAYMGRMSPSYCACLQQPGAPKRLLGGVFSGGGIIVPPAKPAWPAADITHFYAWLEDEMQEAADVYDQIAEEFPHMDPKQWELMMAAVVEGASA